MSICFWHILNELFEVWERPFKVGRIQFKRWGLDVRYSVFWICPGTQQRNNEVSTKISCGNWDASDAAEDFFLQKHATQMVKEEETEILLHFRFVGMNKMKTYWLALITTNFLAASMWRQNLEQCYCKITDDNQLSFVSYCHPSARNNVSCTYVSLYFGKTRFL